MISVPGQVVAMVKTTGVQLGNGLDLAFQRGGRELRTPERVVTLVRVVRSVIPVRILARRAAITEQARVLEISGGDDVGGRDGERHDHDSQRHKEFSHSLSP